jgi:hypothetical protein
MQQKISLKENIKDFDKWNQKKQKINVLQRKVYPKNRDVWYISM